MEAKEVQKQKGKAPVKWICCFRGLGGKTLKTGLPEAESLEAQQQLKLTESDEGSFKSKEDLLNGSDKGNGLSSSTNDAKQLSQVGMDFSDGERASTSKSDGDMMHVQSQWEASTSNSRGTKDGKPVLSAAQKHGKRRKY